MPVLTRKLTNRMAIITMKMTQIKKATAGKGRASLVPLPSFSYLKMESSGPPLVITINFTNDRAGLAKGDACSKSKTSVRDRNCDDAAQM